MGKDFDPRHDKHGYILKPTKREVLETLYILILAGLFILSVLFWSSMIDFDFDELVKFIYDYII